MLRCRGILIYDFFFYYQWLDCSVTVFNVQVLLFCFLIETNGSQISIVWDQLKIASRLEIAVQKKTSDRFQNTKCKLFASLTFLLFIINPPKVFFYQYRKTSIRENAYRISQFLKINGLYSTIRLHIVYTLYINTMFSEVHLQLSVLSIIFLGMLFNKNGFVILSAIPTTTSGGV